MTSLMPTDRQINLTELRNKTIKQSATANEAVDLAVNSLRLLIAFMHHNIVYDLGDMGEANRADLSKHLDPKAANMIARAGDIGELAMIFNEDPAVYKANIDAYLVKYPAVLSEVEAILGA